MKEYSEKEVFTQVKRLYPIYSTNTFAALEEGGERIKILDKGLNCERKLEISTESQTAKIAKKFTSQVFDMAVDSESGIVPFL